MMRKRFYRLLEPSKNKKDPNYYFDLFIMALIILNVLAIILASDKTIGGKYKSFFASFEIFSVIVFSIEYLLRLWTIVEKKGYDDPIKGRIKFIFSPMALIDLFAILPFYLPFLGIDLRFLRILRIFRIFRLLKMARYSSAFTMIKSVLKDKKEELLVTLLFIIIILVIISTLMFYIERDAQPEVFGSIPKSLWWGVVTLTTVGYGDIYPVTALGKILGGIITLLGVGLIALPSGILASGYTEQIQKSKNDTSKD
jgi:voltage-gated potassium channel